MQEPYKSAVKALVFGSMFTASLMAGLYCFDEAQTESLHIYIGFTLILPVIGGSTITGFWAGERLQAR
ncbi:MAG: hypothetical protein ABIR46_01460, partial [Candidatus Saccharimonadales bacterium]